MIPRKIAHQRLLPKNTRQQLLDFLRDQIPPFAAPTDARAWTREAKALRREALAQVYLRGFPLDIVKARPAVDWGETLEPSPDYSIRKLRYEIYPGYWVPALLYVPAHLRGKAPVVLNPNGHHWGGKAAIYKQVRCINLARRGMIALSTEFIGMGELQGDVQHNNLTWIDLTGMAGVGLFYLALQKALDILLEQPHADPDRVAVTGLSGGGWQTIICGALDERVTAIIPVAGYTAVRSRLSCDSDIGDAEQIPADLTTVLDYQHLTAMLAPRPTLQIMNANDNCCFKTHRAKPVIYDAIKPTFEAYDALDKFDFHSNVDPGTHNYEADNRSALYRFLNRHFHLDTPAVDIHDDAELYPESVLNVGLPDGQERFQTIALTRARELASRHRLPTTAAERKALRKKLTAVIRLPEYEATWEKRNTTGDVTTWLATVGPWRIPIIAHRAAQATGVELFYDLGGRKNSWLFTPPKDRHWVVADLLGAGENAGTWQDHLLISCVGQRSLGIQVAQFLALANSLPDELGGLPLHLHGGGYGPALAALLTAALQPRLFASVTLASNLTTLVRPIEWNLDYRDVPALPCFGLLEVADVPQLEALLEKVVLHQPQRCVLDQ